MSRWSALLALASLALLPGRAGAQDARWTQSTTDGLRAFHDGRLGDAETLFLEAVRIAEQTTPREWHLVISLQNLAEAQRAQGKEREAEAAYRRALTAGEELRGTQHPSLVEPLKVVGGFYYGQRRYADAEPFYRRALKIAQRTVGAGADGVSGLFNVLVDLARWQGNYVEAEALAREAVFHAETWGRSDDTALGIALSDLAFILQIGGKMEEARAAGDRAFVAFQRSPERAEHRMRSMLTLRETVLGPEHPGVVGPLQYLARIHETQLRFGEAEALHRRTVAILERAFGAGDLRVAAALEAHAALLEQLRPGAEPRVLAARAAAIRRAVGGDGHGVAAP